jgi:uncharacterized protein (DUF885 family)
MTRFPARTRALGALLVLFPVLHGCASLPGASAAGRFRELHTEEWRWRLAEFAEPEQDGAIADHLPRVDAASQDARLRHWQDVRRQLAAIPRAALPPAEQVNYDVYGPQLDVLIQSQQFRDYEMPANSDSAFWTDLGYTARRPFHSVDDYRHWIAQLRDIPRYFKAQVVEMRAGLARGFTPPRVTLLGRDGSFDSVTGVPPEQTFFYEPFRTMNVVPEADRAALRAEALAAIRDAVQPAYAELARFWREVYVPGTRTTLAALDLPDGAAFYRAKIAEFTTLDLTADQIHDFGLAEVARLHELMLAAMKETGFAGSFEQFLAFLRSDPQFAAKSAEELLMRAAWIAKQFDAKASSYFGRLPRERFAIRPVPDELAPFYTAGRGGPGVYLLNTYNLPSRPLYNLPALTLHESAPGHAFQIPIAAEHKDQPAFRQRTYISAYGEGWALYCETLGVEMGMYRTPYERFGMLGYQIWRAARLVVDTGVHTRGWSRERAIDFMNAYTALPLHEIETEVDRYIAWPAQALSYYLGETEILKARARAEAALGAKFNLRAFHDTVLELGSVPMPVLDARISRFIAEGGKGPYPDEE